MPNHRHCITVKKTNRRNTGANTLTFWLPSNTRRGNIDFQLQQHGTSGPQWRKLPQQTPVTNRSRLTLLPIGQHYHPTKQLQWSAQYSTHHQTRHAISHQSWSSRIIHHGKWSSIHQNNTWGDGAHTSTNPTANRQLDGRGCYQWNSTTKTDKSNGHAISLVTRQRMPKTIPNLLETGQAKLRRLLGKTSPSNTSSEHAHGIHNTTFNIRNAKTGKDSALSSSSSSSVETVARVWWSPRDTILQVRSTYSRYRGPTTQWRAMTSSPTQFEDKAWVA